jgi:hypothetical protein
MALVDSIAGGLIPMSKYHEWLKKSLKQLSDDYSARKFQPENESDVKCHLYHSFLCSKEGIKGLKPAHLVLSEFPVSISPQSSKKKIDLAIVKRTKVEKRVKDEPRLLLEIKETGSDHLEPD